MDAKMRVNLIKNKYKSQVEKSYHVEGLINILSHPKIIYLFRGEVVKKGVWSTRFDEQGRERIINPKNRV